MPASDGGLRRLFRKYLPHVHWTTIESRYTESGIPDINGCYNGREIWLECKATRNWQVILRPMQKAWISRHLRCGGVCYIAVRRRNKHDDELWLLPGAAVQAWAGSLRLMPIVGKWPGGPAKWPWPAVARALGMATGAVKPGRLGNPSRAGQWQRLGAPQRALRGNRGAGRAAQQASATRWCGFMGTPLGCITPLAFSRMGDVPSG